MFTVLKMKRETMFKDNFYQLAKLTETIFSFPSLHPSKPLPTPYFTIFSPKWKMHFTKQCE